MSYKKKRNIKYAVEETDSDYKDKRETKIGLKSERELKSDIDFQESLDTKIGEEKLDLVEKLEKLNYEILNVIFIVNRSGLVTPRFIKLLNYLGYSFYVYLDGPLQLKEIKGIKEEKLYEVSEEENMKYGLKLDLKSKHTVISCIGCNIAGFVFECNNGISYVSCAVKGGIPQEKVYIRVLDKKFLHVEETKQIMTFLVGDLLESDNLLEDTGDFKYPVSYPVIHISDFLNEEYDNIESTVKCSIRTLRNTKLSTEETKFNDFIKNISELKENFMIFDEARESLIENLSKSIGILEENAEKYKKLIKSGNKINERDLEKINKIRYNLKRRHDIVIDIIKTYCIISGFNTILKWINEQMIEVINTFSSSEISKVNKIL